MGNTAVNFTNIPSELKRDCRFCTWKMEKGAFCGPRRSAMRLTAAVKQNKTAA